MSFRFRREIDVEDKIRDILIKFKGKKFNEVTIVDVRRQYGENLEGRKADIAVLIDGGKPILLIETKKKREVGGYSVERRFMVMSEDVLGQVFAYVAILKRNGMYVPFVATANDKQIALFMVPEDIDKKVNWRAIDQRNYDKVLDFRYIHELREKYRIAHVSIRFTEDFFAEIIDVITGIYIKKYGFEEKRQELHWGLIEDLRGFVDFLTPFVLDAIAPEGKYKEDLNKQIEEYAKSKGYKPSPEQLAREMTYVFLNKIIFYKILERHYGSLPRLVPMYREGKVKSVNEYLSKLKDAFELAVRITGDYEAIFHTGIYDRIDVIEDEEVAKAIDRLIDLIDIYKIERFGDIIGYIYEELIPAEERHNLGQFYTPKPIAELITKWCVRNPDDKILDPGCGSGTFLVEAYKRLVELKLRTSYQKIKYVKKDVHEQILNQLIGVDINEFPAHLTAMNLAMRNPKVPSINLRIIVDDYFNIIPEQKKLTPYRIRTIRGKEYQEIYFKNLDAIIGNPPYTRWNELPETTKDFIKKNLASDLKEYNLLKYITGGALPGVYTFWIMHSTKFLKSNGRLGMIISDSWLQTRYGIEFGKYLLDHYKIKAIIDISSRVFPVPIIGACIILLEKESNKEKRDANTVVFTYLHIIKDVNVDEILKVISDFSNVPNVSNQRIEIKGGWMLINTYLQREICEKAQQNKWIVFVFGIERLLDKLKQSPYITRLDTYFDPSEGNTAWSVYASKKGRGAGVGGQDFFYLDDYALQKYGLDKYVGCYIYPLLPSSDRMVFFTFQEKDWKKIKERYIFIANAPKSKLPDEVKKYIELGERVITIKKGPNKGKPVSESSVAKIRKKLGSWIYNNTTYKFHDWYDLGGVIKAPIYVTYGARYWMRFVLAKFNCALDHRILALIPRQGVIFSETELKALLAYLNSSFGQLQAEVKGRTAGGVALLELDVKPLSEFLILDVKKLPKETIANLAMLFDKLEAEARRLGGADSVENIVGSKLAKELTGKEAKEGIEGLFNTVIKEIDYEIARILDLEDLVEIIRSTVIDLMKRRLARSKKARPEAIRGEAIYSKIIKNKKKRKRKERPTKTLDEFLK